ncbi:Jerky -like [Amphibalanus amphitrite]|uniref:Jerky-like n=1 Tax=Amphibalanus amphitrite TaxID=1232801 RepID=A0A6A4X9W0_AMPAM|nr:Jerky -like [Amphibalanus amphitrite]
MPKYTEEDLGRAKKLVADGFTVYKAAKDTGVPYETLRRHIFGINVTGSTGSGRPTVLTRTEEDKLVEILAYLARQAFPLDTSDICDLVQQFLNNLGRETQWKDNRPTRFWLSRFKARHAGVLASRKPEILTITRAKSLTEEVVGAFFSMYNGVLVDLGLEDKPDNIYNLDETGFSTDPRSTRVIVPSKSRDAYLKTASCGKATYSVLFCVNATGSYFPPFVVYKAKREPFDSWMRGGPPGTAYGTTPSGWMEGNIFESWFQTIFVPEITKKHDGQPTVLVYDGHGSHMTYRTAALAKDNNITVVCLPPHTSHAIQPLDVAVFKPVKVAWAQILKRWQRESRLVAVDKSVFPTLISQLWKELDPVHAVAGFRGSGLFPVDAEKVRSRMVGPGSTSRDDIPSPDEALQDAVLSVLSPEQSSETKAALANKTKRRSRVQNKSGEVLTSESSLQRLELEAAKRAEKGKKSPSSQQDRKLSKKREEKGKKRSSSHKIEKPSAKRKVTKLTTRSK